MKVCKVYKVSKNSKVKFLMLASVLIALANTSALADNERERERESNSRNLVIANSCDNKTTCRTTTCHTEACLQAEVSKKPSNRDISAFAKPKYDKLEFIKLAQLDSTPTNARYFSQNTNSATSTHPLAPSAREGGQNTKSANNNSNLESKGDTDSSDNLQAKDLGKITAFGHRESNSAYQGSAGTISRGMLDSSSSGNGDITSILRLLPNVQFDNASGSSNTPGEIDPAKISISGGLYFQNNFQLDGFNMNNDLDPAGGGTTDNQTSIRSGNSQGLNIDTSLLDSITVLDSNVSAAYGGFSGGVVKAEVRKARKDSWHGNISYQFTQGNADLSKFSLTQYHIDDTVQKNQLQGFEVSAWQRLWNSSSEAYQPAFTKHLVKSSLEGYITEKLGFVASFTTTQSFIPLRNIRKTDTGTYDYGPGQDDKREQKRQSYNYYLKVHYDASDYIRLEANIGYAPQYNTYYNDAAINSYYAMESGGIQSGAKVIWQTPIGLWTNSFGYSSLENSRRGDADHFYFWYRSVDKNWAGMRALVYEGGWGNVDQLQNKLELKSEFESNPIRFSLTRNTLKFGIGFEQFEIVRDYLNDVYWNQGAPMQIFNASQHCGVDSMGFVDSCSESKTLNANTGQPNQNNYGQFQSTIRLRPKGKYEYWGKNFNAYLEDDIKITLGNGGDLNLRPGIRYDGDSYMGKHSVAPRFAMNYVTPAPKDWQTTLTFGANRYYGRSLFTYWLYAQSTSQWKVYRRSMCTREGQANCIEVNTPTAWVEQNNYNLASFFHFEKLKVPFDDELMGGIKQNLGIFEISAKYIHRFGRDEVMRQDTGNVQSRADYYWNNNGSSQSQIISVILQNIKPIQTLGVIHHYLLAFDWTQTKRGYNVWFNTSDGVDRDDDEYTNNGMIYYDGKLIHYRDRPVENFLRPWTLRLTTTHRFNILRTRWTLNNFFRLRAKFERMLNNGGIQIDGQLYPRYDKIPFNQAFSWDMRLGFEVDIYRGKSMRHTVYVNMDIFNVLNARNKTTMQGALVTNGVTPGISGVTASTGLTDFAVYELGRQFWFQVGYKF